MTDEDNTMFPITELEADILQSLGWSSGYGWRDSYDWWITDPEPDQATLRNPDDPRTRSLLFVHLFTIRTAHAYAQELVVKAIASSTADLIRENVMRGPTLNIRGR